MAALTCSSRQSNIQSWQALCPLGRGSSAVVSLALALPQSFFFALKSPLSSSSSELSLLNEFQILSPLSSPFLVRCFGGQFEPESSTPRSLFLEFMDGGTLADLLTRSGGRLGESLVRRYTRSIVHGLHYLHNNGIVHCDIKGQNILIGSTGVKIADFGAAKKMKGPQDKGETGQSDFRGTPLWMAPEVVQGLEQGCPADIWSLGCTVVEMIQGRPPWGRNITDMAAALYKLACSDEDPPLPDCISDDARDFLLHCLQRNPEDRWTASQLLQHPFLGVMESTEGDEAKHAQLSPRSILECISSDSEMEDRIDDSTTSTFSSDGYFASEQPLAEDMPLNRTAVSTDKRLPDAFKSEKCEWITVKRPLSSSRLNQEVPFMEHTTEGELEVKKACDVSLKGAMFLRNRKTVG